MSFMWNEISRYLVFNYSFDISIFFKASKKHISLYTMTNLNINYRIKKISSLKIITYRLKIFLSELIS